MPVFFQFDQVWFYFPVILVALLVMYTAQCYKEQAMRTLVLYDSNATCLVPMKSLYSYVQ